MMTRIILRRRDTQYSATTITIGLRDSELTIFTRKTKSSFQDNGTSSCDTSIDVKFPPLFTDLVNSKFIRYPVEKYCTVKNKNRPVPTDVHQFLSQLSINF